MRKYLLQLVLVFIVAVFYSVDANSFEMTTIKGTAQFRSNLLAKYMKKHGYLYIDEIIYGRKYKTNLYAAKNASIIIKNKYDTVLAEGSADSSGRFSFSVPRDNNYKIIVTFHDRTFEKEVRLEQTADYAADLGLFDSDTVESWFPSSAVMYCYKCGLRYIENKEASL